MRDFASVTRLENGFVKRSTGLPCESGVHDIQASRAFHLGPIVEPLSRIHRSLESSYIVVEAKSSHWADIWHNCTDLIGPIFQQPDALMERMSKAFGKHGRLLEIGWRDDPVGATI